MQLRLVEVPCGATCGLVLTSERGEQGKRETSNGGSGGWSTKLFFLVQTCGATWKGRGRAKRQYPEIEGQYGAVVAT